MKKRIVCALLVLCMVLSLSVSAGAAEKKNRGRNLAELTEALKNAPVDDSIQVEATLVEEQEAASLSAIGAQPQATTYADYYINEYTWGQYVQIGTTFPLRATAFVETPNIEYWAAAIFGPDDKLIGTTEPRKFPSAGTYDLTCTRNTTGDKPGTYNVLFFSYNLNGDPIFDYSDEAEYHEVTKAVSLKSIAWYNVSTHVCIAKGGTDLGPSLIFDPSNTTQDRNPTYFSYDTSVCTVDNMFGLPLIEGTGYGTATLRATVGSKNAYNLVVEVCKDSYGHNLTSRTIKPATCTESGSYVTACTKCGWEKSAPTTVPALGHDWVPGAVLKPEVGDEWGQRMETCSRCGDTREASFHTCPGAAFTDHVKDSHFAHKGIDYCIKNGLMSGTKTTLFAPKTTMSRAMLVTVLYRMEGQPGAGSTTFTDVKSTAWYAEAVSWAADNGIVGGVGNGKFDPNGNVTREQIATILYRYADFKGVSLSSADLSGFADADKVGKWFIGGMRWAVAENLITGVKRDGKLFLDPQGAATREQVATILMRFCQFLGK